MQTILTVFHIFLAVGLVGLILIQHGKGADMGAAFGSGASGTVFGAKGSASFLTRATALLATLFFVTSMVMAYFASQRNEQVGVMEALDQAPAVQVEEVQQSDIPPIPVESDMPAIAPPAEPTDTAPREPAATEAVEMGTEAVEGANAEASQEQAKE
ncbi:MAG: preprotein translocase subunit SecG [Candidatus Thiodiazotropha sp. (ex Ctena orbiculata)]|uniref:Protein-export membrane protein SecG n=1 Tax=Candidatus Thiodiazotropha taylori TaxID=2792791 RepID=A0A944M7H2_9GAMM|nr:preprotein translocase subunit SecG [Candidatus Thiodiazotropha taylori]PUB88236.1 MAG: preprotein translocase subunit SecG [gamma proteobacterium symbiont of Ctena orbiculata]MBT2988588.1 preprotein translocase subunit SecG [Candidatus Thiodiazotropha taylori]MBT2997443.1 preprotein translocase subunit SecG [Candidatus Thiodiazotropha taylori]MBT3001117.1 preprotein translocase subunit SecG [Candidatus Thiodiazotropha taylori]